MNEITENELKKILKVACAAPVGRAMYGTLSLEVVRNRDLLDKNIWRMLSPMGLYQKSRKNNIEPSAEKTVLGSILLSVRKEINLLL